MKRGSLPSCTRGSPQDDRRSPDLLIALPKSDQVEARSEGPGLRKSQAVRSRTELTDLPTHDNPARDIDEIDWGGPALRKGECHRQRQPSRVWSTHREL